MKTSQIPAVNPAGRSSRDGRVTRAGFHVPVQPGSGSHDAPGAVALLVTLVLTLAGGVAPVLCRAQETPAAKPAEPAAENQDVSLRYRFLERYSATEDPTKPDLLTQYQVGCRETVKVTREKPQGAPDQQQTVGQGIYTERVAKLAKGAAVTEVVRRYDKIDITTTLDIPRYKTKLLEGLTILYRPQPQGRFLPPQVLSLTPGRQLRPLEYDGIRQQSFLPIVSFILPRKPSRVGDTWPVRREVAFALLGNAPAEEDYDLTAEILEVRKNGPGPTMTAIIGVKGQVVVPEGPSGINALVHFTFVPTEVAAPAGSRNRDETTKDPAAGSQPAPVAAPGPAGRVKGLFDANGYISKVSMAQEISFAQPGNDGRLKGTIRRELLVERRTLAQAGGVLGLLELPNPAPSPNVANSWLIHDDPQGRFHLMYPQEMHVARSYPDGGIDLLNSRPDGQDVIQLTLTPKTQDPQHDRLPADPIQDKKQLEDDWKKKGEKVVPGPSGWLAEAEWAPLKRKVYRIEAALIPETDGSPSNERIYLDRYIVQFTRNEVMKVTAMTIQDPHVQFREMAEVIIKSFEFGPSESSLPSSPTPVPTTPRTR